MRPLLAAFAALLLAGCSSAPDPEPLPAAAPDVITDPAMGLNQTGAHIHDYWKGQDRLTIIGEDAEPDESGLGPGLAGGPDVPVRAFQPSSGHVVPQGTSSVEVTFTWADAGDGLDSYGEVSAWVKTAGTNLTERLGAAENGQTLVLETGLPAADLPHQLLSAWVFELRMSADPTTGVLRFKGDVAVDVVAVRGLDLPIFPAHPDHWKGASEIALVDGAGQLSYFADLGDGGCDGMSCPQVFTPRSGAIVPGNSSHVTVEITWTGPVTLQLWYHSATSRELALADGAFMAAGGPVAGGQATYELPTGDGPDGPYATQSQWEFTVLPVGAPGGATRTAWMADYTITAKAVRA